MSKPSQSAVASAFAEVPQVKPRVPCKVGAVLAALDPAGRDAVQAAIADTDNWMASEIARRLTDLGHPLKGDNVSRHRRGVLRKGGDACECPPIR
jgi:hypothetical protein